MENLVLEELIDPLKKISIEAGDLIMEVYGQDDFSVQSKLDDSPLTIADQMANKHICAQLELLTPDIPIISEENKTISYDQRKNHHFCWMVDPLDGTKEFIKRNGEFTVNIALIQNGQSILGVIYVPVTSTLYYGLKGKGSYKEKQGVKSQLKARTFTTHDPGLRVVCSRSHLNPATQRFIDDLLFPQTVAKGSSLKFMILAEGGAELYPRLAPTMEWDTAAAQVILEEAGGYMYRAVDRSPMEYNKESLLNPHFIATGNLSNG